MGIPRIRAGEAISAGRLINPLVDAANGLTGLGANGAPGAGLRVGGLRRSEYLGAIVGRSLPGGSPPYKLHEITYTAHVPGLAAELTIPWNHRVVAVAAELLGPTADPAMLFYPAPIAGSGDAPWRWYCRVTVLHGVGPADGAPTWWAHVPGEAPAYGCVT